MIHAAGQINHRSSLPPGGYRYDEGSGDDDVMKAILRNLPFDVIRRLAVSLDISADMLVFDKQERDPGEQLRYQSY
jgi:hypothetical protein